MKAYSQKYNSIKGQNFVEGKSELLPIPEDQVTLSNGALEQNPGYWFRSCSTNRCVLTFIYEGYINNVVEVHVNSIIE